MVPPMSTTTASPGLSTRSEGSWCGLAAFGPDPTMTKSILAWPSAAIALAMSAAASRAVRRVAEAEHHHGPHLASKADRADAAEPLGHHAVRVVGLVPHHELQVHP